MYRIVRRLALLAVVVFALGVAVAALAVTLEVRATAAAMRGEVEALREFRVSRPGWSFTGEIWSDGLDLVPGAPYGLDRVEAEAEARGYHRDGRGVALDLPPGAYRREGRDRLLLSLRGFGLHPDGPCAPATVRVSSARGGTIEAVEVLRGGPCAGPHRLEPLWMGEWMGDANEARIFTPLAEIPAVVRDAVIASEDVRFRDHIGIDPVGIARALRRNVAEQEAVEGASTLTQQLVRTLFLDRERSYRRKAAEALRALALETLLTKDEILEMYLNSIYLGQRGGQGIGGVAAGARAYFGVGVGELDLARSALLTAVIPAPNTFSPWKAPERAKERRDRVIDRMAELGMVAAEDAARAKASPLGLADPGEREPFQPLYAAWARRHLERAAGEGEPPAGRGLRVFTALSPALQARAERAVVGEIAAFEASWGPSPRDPLQGALIGLDPASGLAPFAVAGRGREGDQFHRAVQARRQPGSAIKPVAYAAAFALRDDEGRFVFTPATTVPDEPRDFDTPEGPWRPRNAEGFYHPWVSLAKAFGKSLNVATTSLVQEVGPERIAALARDLGISSPLRPVPSIGLGTSEVTLVELTGALSGIAAGGLRVDPSPVRLAVDPRGQVAFRAEPPRERVLDPRSAAMVMTLMRGSFDKGTGWLARSTLGYGRDVAGKTGTSQGGKDLWFVGVTPRLAIGYWLGHDRGRPMHQTASDTIAPSWGRIARVLLDDTAASEFGLPEGVELAGVEPWSGCRGGSWRVAMPKDQPWPGCRPVTWEIPEDSQEGEEEGIGGEGVSAAVAVPEP